ncbi:hypothetical protein LUZ61_017937 [Rhynchospora tenuis]|uniref:KIB1-4 beta-propeller domain-containing protein n=1 Tax=Rhynchospora tenuis TaxID=198213 RepID=A0AAD6ELG7_9POAL|nr:hypothetical protein LUZ61_017937 [Rhynchospora tenuis]
MEGHSDWANLPQLVLHRISEKLKSITDFVRFCTVCSPWRSAPLQKLRRFPPQLPWVLIPYNPNVDKEDVGVRHFYDLWEKTVHKLHLPDIIGKSCHATHRGWLLVIETEGRELFLLNPLTGARVKLPPFNTPIRHLGEDWDAPRHDTPHRFSPSHQFRCTKVILSSDLTDPNCLITVYLYRLVIFCYRVGDPCWTMVNTPLNNYLEDVTYYNGRFYLLYEHYEANKGDIVIIDSDKPDKPIEYNFEPHERVKFVLYQFQEQPMKLKPITETSNITIFNTDNFRFLAVCSADWDSLAGASMYTVCYFSPDQETVGYYYSIRSAKREDGKMERLWDLDEEPLVLDGQKEPVMWFQPSFV